MSGTTYTASASVADVAGNTSAAVASATLAFDNVVVTPTLALVLDTGINGDGITSNGTFQATGLEAGATVVEYSTGALDVNGALIWSTVIPTAAEGPNTVLVRQTDAAGNVSLASAPLNFTLDTILPATPSISLTTDSGTPGDGVTNSASVNLVGLEGGTTAVAYRVYAGATPPAGPATWTPVVPTGVLLNQFTPTGAAGAALADGAYTVEVLQTDLAGNISTSGALAFTLDTAPPTTPAAPSVTPAAGTNPTTLSVLVPANAVAGDVLSLALTDAANAPIMPTGSVTLTQANLGGSVTFTVPALVNGTYSATAQLTDQAGNASAASVAAPFLVGGTLPAAATISLVSDTGISATDRITSNAALTITVDPAATAAGVSYVLDGGAPTATYTAPTLDGLHTLVISSPSGTVPATFSFTLDTAITAPIVNLTADTGTYNTDKITNNGAITVTGLDPNVNQVIYTLSFNGAQIGAVPSTATVVNGVATMPSPTLGDGLYSVSVYQTDKAGNGLLGVSPTTTLAYTLDTVAVAPMVNLTDSSGVATVAWGATTASVMLGTPVGEVGATFQYSLNGSTGWTDLALYTPTLGTNSLYVHQTDMAGNVSPTVIGTPDVSFILSSGSANGALPTIALVSDTAPGPVTPAPWTNAAVNADHLTNLADLTITPSALATSVVYSIDAGLPVTVATAGVAVPITLSPVGLAPVLIDGIHTITAYEVNAGGAASASATYTFTTDTLAPSSNLMGLNPTDFQGLYLSTSGTIAAYAVMRVTYNEAVNIDAINNQPVLLDAAMAPLVVAGGYTATPNNAGLASDGVTHLGPQLDALGNVIDVVEIRFTETTLGSFAAAFNAGTFVPISEVLVTDMAGNVPTMPLVDFTAAGMPTTIWTTHVMP
jgi:hypothetical protein